MTSNSLIEKDDKNKKNEFKEFEKTCSLCKGQFVSWAVKTIDNQYICIICNFKNIKSKLKEKGDKENEK